MQQRFVVCGGSLVVTQFNALRTASHYSWHVCSNTFVSTSFVHLILRLACLRTQSHEFFCRLRFRFLTAEQRSYTSIRTASCHFFSRCSLVFAATLFAYLIGRTVRILSTQLFFFLLVPAGLLAPSMIPVPFLRCRDPN